MGEKGMMEWGSYGVEKRETTDYTDEHRFKNGGGTFLSPLYCGVWGVPM